MRMGSALLHRSPGGSRWRPAMYLYFGLVKVSAVADSQMVSDCWPPFSVICNLNG